jgi:hypothetical protein
VESGNWATGGKEQLRRTRPQLQPGPGWSVA